MTNYDILKEYEAHKTPVPSYEELKSLNEDIDITTELWKHERRQLNEKIQLICNLVEENAKLKELLKECQGVLLTYSNMHGNYELYDRIDEVLNVAKD